MMIETLEATNPLLFTALGAGSAVLKNFLDIQGRALEQSLQLAQGAGSQADGASTRHGSDWVRYALIGAAIVVTALFPFVVGLLPDISTIAEVVRQKSFLGLGKKEVIEHVTVDGFLMIQEYRAILTAATFFGLGVLPFMGRR